MQRAQHFERRGVLTNTQKPFFANKLGLSNLLDLDGNVRVTGVTNARAFSHHLPLDGR